MQKDSIGQSIKVILGICLICSFLVSAAAVFLNPIQQENKRLDKVRNILIAGDLYADEIDVDTTYRQKIEPLMIELKTGEGVSADQFNDTLNIDNFDIQTFSTDLEYGETLPADEDIAKIKWRPRHMVVYFVKTGDQIHKLILPVYGKGLWSTLYGFLALDSDLQNITGITFYQHGETPGLGGEVDNPRWKNQWRGKRAFDSHGKVIIKIIRGAIDPLTANASHQIEGLSGATITSRGVNNLVTYWLGETGYGPFLT